MQGKMHVSSPEKKYKIMQVREMTNLARMKKRCSAGETHVSSPGGRKRTVRDSAGENNGRPCQGKKEVPIKK